MSAGLLGGYAAAGVVGEQCVEEVQAVLFKVVDEIFVVITRPFGEGRLEVGKARDAGPDLLVGGAEGTVGVVRDDVQEARLDHIGYLPEDLEDLIDFGVAREERPPSTHLGENAADRPHVDASRILSSSEKDLGRTVP